MVTVFLKDILHKEYDKRIIDMRVFWGYIGLQKADISPQLNWSRRRIKEEEEERRKKKRRRRRRKKKKEEVEEKCEENKVKKKKK